MNWRALAHRLSHLAGYEIRRPGASGRTMRDALMQLRRAGLAPSTVVDVGVGFGTPDLYRIFPEPTYLLVEPVAEYEPALKALLREEIHGSYVIAAAGAQSGVVQLNIRGEASSIYRDVDRSDVGAAVRQVPLKTLDQLCEERALVGPYLIKVDVQGAELEVLAGAQTLLTNAGAVLLEVSLFELLEDAPIFAEVVRTMDNRGFAVYDIFDGLARPADGALAQIDIAFVGTDGPLRRYQGFRPSS